MVFSHVDGYIKGLFWFLLRPVHTAVALPNKVDLEDGRISEAHSGHDLIHWDLDSRSVTLFCLS